MTAIAERRRRRTLIGAISALVLVVAAASMFVAGVITLSNSREGEAVGIDDRPRERFPDTPNALIAVTDDAGRLASLVVATLLPQGTGGSIVTIPVNADGSAGFGSDRIGLNAEFDTADVDGFVTVVEGMLSVTMERSAVLGPSELEELLAPLGPISVVLPADVRDSDIPGEASADGSGDDSGDSLLGEPSPGEPAVAAAGVVLPAGPHEIDADEAVELLTAIDDDAPEYGEHLTDVSVWEAVANSATMSGPDTTVPLDELGEPVAPTSVQALVQRLWAGEVGVRDLAVATSAEAGDSAEADVVLVDRRDSALVFGQVSPSLVSSSNPGVKMRVVAPYTAGQLDQTDGLFESNTDLAREFIGQMLDLENNVISADTAAVGAPEVTVVEVADESFLDETVEAAEALFGEAEVRLATTVVEGVDMEVTLGMTYLIRELVRVDMAATVDADG